MASLAEQTGLDRRFTPFVLLWAAGAALLIATTAMVLPALAPAAITPPADWDQGLVLFTLLVTALGLVVMSCLAPSALPFTLAGWAVGWHLLWRVGAPPVWAAVAGGLLASVAAMIGPWALRALTIGAGPPETQAMLLPYLAATAMLAAMVIYPGDARA